MSQPSLQAAKKYINLSLTQRPFFNPSFSKESFFTNHLYMAEIALFRMGATEKQIETFSNYFLKEVNVQKCKSKVDENLINSENFQDYIGKYDHFEEWYAFFKRENKQKGIKEVLKEYIPKLSQGIGSEAYHCIIQIGYAIDWDFVEEEILYGLSYLALQNVSLYPKEQQPDQRNALEVLKDLKQNKEYFRNLPEMLYKKRLYLIDSDENFLKIVPKKVVLYDKLLDDLQLEVLKLFIESEDFFILHVVSGISCLRSLLPYIDEKDKERLVNDMILHIFTSYANTTFSNLPEKEEEKKLKIPNDLPQWSQIFALANNSMDVHDIKFVYICWIEAKHYGENSEHGRYSRYAASIRMKMKS